MYIIPASKGISGEKQGRTKTTGSNVIKQFPSAFRGPVQRAGGGPRVRRESENHFPARGRFPKLCLREGVEVIQTKGWKRVPGRRNGMGKGSETFCNTAKKGNITCEGWAGARPGKAGSARPQPAKRGGGDGNGRQGASR